MTITPATPASAHAAVYAARQHEWLSFRLPPATRRRRPTGRARTQCARARAERVDDMKMTRQLAARILQRASTPASEPCLLPRFYSHWAIIEPRRPFHQK